MNDPTPPRITDEAATPSRRQRPGWLSLVVLVLVVGGAFQALSWWRQQQLGEQLRERARPGDIVMYTTSDCPYCAKARRWLDAERVVWQECNVDRSPVCLRGYEAVGAPGVPLFHVRGRWQLGFDPRGLSDLLAGQGRASSARP